MIKKSVAISVIVVLAIGGLSLFFLVVFKIDKPVPRLLPKGPQQLYSISDIESATKKAGDEPPQSDLSNLTNYVFPEIGLDELTEYLSDDNVCKIENSAFTLNDAALALLKAPDLIRVDAASDKLLSEVFSQDEKMVKDSDSANIVKFFNALMLADLFFGSESPEVNFQKAFELLEELKIADSENGAVNFVQAYVLSKLNAPEKIVKAEYQNAFLKKQVDFYSGTIQNRLFEKSFATASHWLIFRTIQERLDEINLAPSTFLLHNYIQQNDSAFNKGAIAFARLLIPAQIKEGYAPILKSWETSNYIFGQKILSWAWKSAYPGQVRPAFEPLKRLTVVNFNSLNQGTEAFRNLRKSSSNFFTCKREFFDVWYTQSKIQELEKHD